MPSFASTQRGYHNLWEKAEVRSASANKANDAALTVIKYRSRYEKVAERIGNKDLWPLIGAIHYREASFSFAGVLHNGDKIIGTGRKTVHVPAGRGPFSTWEEAAVDALVLKGWHRITDWYLIERWLYETESFNGFGNFNRVNSSYVWAGTTLQQAGMWVADHVFDKTAWDSRLGVAAILKALFKLRPELAPKGATAPAFDPTIITATTTTPVIAVAVSQGDHGMALGASIAFVFLLAAWVQQNKGSYFMKYILTNGKTTALGAAGILGGLATLVTMLANGNYEPNALMGAAGAIASGLGLIFAKDGNVTGGVKPNTT